MKKGILVLSALLTLVVSGICLQSCSSEYGEYTTEEYGFYTEEEIAEIMALAEKYDLDIEIKFNNFGEKKPLSDFEAKFQAISQIKGRYEMIPVENNDGMENCICRKVEMPVSRISTSSLEKGSWSGSRIASVLKIEGFRTYYENYDISVSVSWDLTSNVYSERVKASANISDLYNVGSKISAGLSGSETIQFSGSIWGEEDFNNEVFKYTFNIVDGEVNRKTRNGSFFLK